MPVELLDFYVAMYAQFTSKAEVWLVYKGECRASCCVGSYDNRQQATDHAISMAEYHAAGGQPAQVRVQANHGDSQHWQTIWRSGDARK